MKRTHNGVLRLANIEETVLLKGWVSKKRDLGGLLFIDLRDTTGIIQLAFYPENPLHDIAAAVKNEYVLEVEGVVQERSNKNMQIPTGEIEVIVTKLTVLNTAQQPPLMIQDETDALEDTRLKYRYLDLRRPVLQSLFKMRHKAAKAVR